ncbi:hypothetical protein Csa_001210 [Cucumis sativus]|uniref:Uncharacterized protein n=1 Tax=Cucumis sativus TaxID=3659 RepID=A0A0A0LBR6_CUCSA|nr:hypothetical protein Csa_001210 [Cucumis sativus]
MAKNIKLSSLEPNVLLISKYNGVLNEVWDLSLLSINVRPLELGEDTYGLASMVQVESLDDYDVDVDAEAFKVSEVDTYSSCKSYSIDSLQQRLNVHLM